MSEDHFHSVIVNKKDRGFSAATVIPLGATSLVFVSGEVGRDESGKIVSGGFEAEVRLVVRRQLPRLLRSRQIRTPPQRRPCRSGPSLLPHPRRRRRRASANRSGHTIRSR